MPRAPAAAQRDAAQANEEEVLNISEYLSLPFADPAGAGDAGASGGERSWREGRYADDASEESEEGETSKLGDASDLDAAFDEAEEALALDEAFSVPAAADLEGPAAEGEAGADADGAGKDLATERHYTSGECALAADISAAGYVTCSLPPWRGMGNVGRLTDWPADVAPEQRACSMKCWIHRGRCAIVRRRRHVTDDMMVRWLFGRRILPEGTCNADMEYV